MPGKGSQFGRGEERTRCLTFLETESGMLEKAVEARCLINEAKLANGKNHEPPPCDESL